MNNAFSYVGHHHLIYHSSDEEQEEWEARGNSFIKSQKSIKQQKKTPKATVKYRKQFDTESIKMMKSSSMLLPGQKNGMKEQQCIGVKVKAEKSKKNNNLTMTEHNFVKNKKVIVHSKIDGKQNLNKTLNSIPKSEDSCSLHSNTDSHLKQQKFKKQQQPQHQHKKQPSKQKQRSTSRDYLIINNDIYQCENLQQINQKIIIGQSSDLLNPGRFYKAAFRNIQKISKYLKSFLTTIQHNNKKNAYFKNMPKNERLRLFQLLKKERMEKESQQSEKIIGKLIKEAMQKLQVKSEYALMYAPQNRENIIKWKNIKMHQLQAIRSYFRKHYYEKYDGYSLQEEIAQLLEDEQSLYDVNYSSLRFSTENVSIAAEEEEYINQTVSFSEQEHHNPQSFEEISHPKDISPIKSIKSSSKSPHPPKYQFQSKYPPIVQPSPKISSPIQLSFEHIFAQNGIILFLQKFWDFMVDANYIEPLLDTIHQAYQPKCLMPELLNSQQNPTLILDDKIFIDFCKNCIQQNFFIENYEELYGNEDEYERYIVIFHKMLFDHCQEVVVKYQIEYPLGKVSPLSLDNSLSTYLIDQENVMSVWNEVITETLSSHSHHFSNQKIIPKPLLQIWTAQIIQEQRINLSRINQQTICSIGFKIEQVLLQELLRDILPMI